MPIPRIRGLGLEPRGRGDEREVWELGEGIGRVWDYGSRRGGEVIPMTSFRMLNLLFRMYGLRVGGWLEES